MAIKAYHKKVEFGVGDKIRVLTRVEEADKKRKQTFEGTVIGIKGRDKGKTFTVRKIGVNQIGIEKIFPLFSPIIESVEVVRKGTRGSRRAKLYYIREKPRREIEKIYSRTTRRELVKKEKVKVKKRPAKKKSGTKNKTSL